MSTQLLLLLCLDLQIAPGNVIFLYGYFRLMYIEQNNILTVHLFFSRVFTLQTYFRLLIFYFKMIEDRLNLFYVSLNNVQNVDRRIIVMCAVL